MDKAKKKSTETAPAADANAATVFIVEDDPITRDFLQELIRSVGFGAESFESAEVFLKHYNPAVSGCVLTDVRMPGMSGLELQEQLRSEQIRVPVIIMTAHADVPMAVRAMRSGAFDFIEKPVNPQALLERIRHAIDRDNHQREDQKQIDDLRKRLELLSPREREVMGLVVGGMLNKQIAHELGLSIKTVEVHRSRVMEKMKADNLAELVRYSTALEPDDSPAA